ncbi:MAG: PH domain-containing protein [Saprospiraceae bacterium]|nr:PH domain-containing protein [Saprospiraceae bacterium]
MPEFPFENIPVEIDSLPLIEESDFIPVEKKYANVLYLSWSLFFSIVLLGLFILIFFKLGFFYWLSYALMFAWLSFYMLSLWFAHASVRNKKYQLRSHDISYREGIFFQSWITIPFSRVQHCEIIKGVIDNMIGLVELRIFTAGGSSSDLVIPGLTPDVAFALKEHIIGKISADDEEE